MTEPRVFTGTQVDADTHRRLHELAERNDRSIAAELRLALRLHLERTRSQEDGRQ